MCDRAKVPQLDPAPDLLCLARMDWFEASDVKVLVPMAGEQTSAEEEATQRVRRLGASALTDTELLEVLGVSTEGDVRHLLKHGLVHLLDASEVGFEVAPRLTARLLASLELARRVTALKLTRPRIFSPKTIATWARAQLIQQRLEETWVLSLNSRNALLRHDRVGVGGVDHCMVDPREVLAPAVACRASGIVLLHTHPGGDAEPSATDVALTRRLKAAAAVLSITVLDHLVLSDTTHVSMLERGLIESARTSPLRKRALADEDD